MRYFYSVLAILIFGGIPTFSIPHVYAQNIENVQENDSLSKREQVSPSLKLVGNRIDSIRKQANLYSQQVDSLQNQIEQPFFSGTVQSFIDELLVDMTLLQTEIDSLQNNYSFGVDTEDAFQADSTDSIEIQNILDKLETQLGNAISEAESLQQYTADSFVSEIDTLADSLSADSIPVIGKLPILDKKVLRQMRSNFNRDRSPVPYFDYSSWSNRIFLFVFSLMYFYWLYRGRKKSPDNSSIPSILPPEPVWISIVKAIIFFLILLPFVSLRMPLLVIQYSYLLIFTALFIVLHRQITDQERKTSGFLLMYYLLLLLINLLISKDIGIRISAGLINIAGIYLVWKIGNYHDTDNPAKHLHRYARWGIIAAYILAIGSNIGGYIEHARMWTSVAGVSLLQIISLKAFRNMLRHDLETQFATVSKLHTLKKLRHDKVLNSFDKLLKLCSTALVFIILFNILGVMGEVIAAVKRIFNKDHQIGSITFNYSNLLLAVAVLWLSNWLQKNLKNLLDDTSERDLHVKKMTLFPLFRLAIIIVGFLFAINILGLGVDKLTVIIGALSVGIGLGLQNIINNFVSGVILVFEKPFKIGDYIEIGDKTGQVLEIGIRSSTLLTDQGAKVIVPNGDLLSGRLVNWTFSNTDIRVNFELVVSNEGQIEEIKAYIRTKLAGQKHVDKSVPIKVYTKDITATDYRLSVQVGISNVKYIERFRSKFLEEITSQMKAQGVSISSI